MGLSVIGFPWAKKGLTEYEATCRAAEITIDPLTPSLWKKLLANLSYDTRSTIHFGRCLVVDLPEHGLRRGDRLEPSVDIPDTGDGLNARCPPRVVFWRHSSDLMTIHRNPVFDPETGVVPDKVLAMDWLHVMPLGVLRYFNGSLVWALISAGAWVRGNVHATVLLERSVGRMKSELFAWYSREASAGRHHCRVQALTHGVVGSRESPVLKLHGAESNCFLLFAGELLRRHGDVLGDDMAHWMRAQTCFAQTLRLTREHPVFFPPAAQQEFMNNVLIGLRALEELGVAMRPKVHALMHIAHASREKGSLPFGRHGATSPTTTF